MGPLSSSSSSSNYQHPITTTNHLNSFRVDELLQICQDKLYKGINEFFPVNLFNRPQSIKDSHHFQLYEVIQMGYAKVKKSDISEDDVQLLEETVIVENHHQVMQEFKLAYRKTQEVFNQLRNSHPETFQKVTTVLSAGQYQASECIELYNHLLSLKYKKIESVKKETNPDQQKLIKESFDTEIYKLLEKLHNIERERKAGMEFIQKLTQVG